MRIICKFFAHNSTIPNFNQCSQRNTEQGIPARCSLRFVFHTRTNFSLHNADGSVILNVNNCIFASTHQLHLFKEIRNPVNTDNHGPINRQPTRLFNASELRSNRLSSNLGTSLADIFRILLPLAQRIGYYHTRRLPAVSPVLIARCAATTRTNSGGD